MDSSDTDPLSSYKTAELVATYEELFQVPDEERLTYYFGDLGGHFFNHGVTAEQKKAAYEKALARDVGRLDPHLLRQIVLRHALALADHADALSQRGIIQIHPVTSNKMIVAPFRMW